MVFEMNDDDPGYLEKRKLDGAIASGSAILEQTLCTIIIFHSSA